MTHEEFRTEFEGFRDRVNEEAIASKISHEAYEELRSLYARLDSGERLIANEIVTE